MATDTLDRLWATRFGAAPSDADRAALGALDGDVERLALLAAAPDGPTAARWAAEGPGGWVWRPLEGTVARWEASVAATERRIRAQLEGRVGVFGCCVRCGSQRLVVLTKQLRCADEGQGVAAVDDEWGRTAMP